MALQVVVFHDPDLERMTGVKGHITSFEAHRLPPIRVTQDHFGVNDTNRAQAIRIPRLEEVLDLLPPDMPIIIEFKQDSLVRP